MLQPACGAGSPNTGGPATACGGTMMTHEQADSDRIFEDRPDPHGVWQGCKREPEEAACPAGSNRPPGSKNPLHPETLSRSICIPVPSAGMPLRRPSSVGRNSSHGSSSSVRTLWSTDVSYVRPIGSAWRQLAQPTERWPILRALSSRGIPSVAVAVDSDWRNPRAQGWRRRWA